MPPPETSAELELAARHLRVLHALLAEHVPHAEVRAFGSRVHGGAHEGSDLDLVLLNGDDPERPVAGTARLVEALQMSALPMRVEVHDWAALPAQFRAEIERGYRTLQAR